MKASLNNYRQAPRKVRLITSLISGKGVVQAQSLLSNLIKRGSLPVKKLLDSAVANAGVPAADLVVKRRDCARTTPFPEISDVMRRTFRGACL
jgi:large subunit ribosomal protein L22